MTINRRRTLAGLLSLTAFALPFGQVLANDNWPTKAVTVVVPFAPGGAVDQLARAMTTKWSQDLGQTFVVVNRPGAVGAVAAAEVARAKPDGYTLLFALDSHATSQAVNPSTPYDVLKDFEYISQLITLPLVIVVPAASPFKTLEDLVEAGKTQKLTYGINGIASAAHLNATYLMLNQQFEAEHAAYRGAGPMSTDVVGGHLDFASGALSVMLPFIKSGAIRALAVSSLERSPLIPDVPAVSELVPGHDVQSWVGLVAPAGIADGLRDRLHQVVKAALADAELRKSLEAQSFQIVGSSPDELHAIVERDAAAMKKLVESGAIKVE